METGQLRAALVTLLWRSIADDAECTCYPGDQCPECQAMQALGLGRWTGAGNATDLLAGNDVSCGHGYLAAPARCDCCGNPLPAGEKVATFYDERIGDHVMHWDKCPEPEMWRASYPLAGRIYWDVAMPYEEAYVSARTMRDDGFEGVRLVRVRPRQALTEARTTEGA